MQNVKTRSTIPFLIHAVKDLVHNRELLYMITWREIRIRYKQSIMGLLWAVFMPIMIISAGMLVKFVMARMSGRSLDLSQVATISVKGLPWSFFIASLRYGTLSLTSNANLVTKLNFPKEIFPISAVLSQLADFAVACLFLVVVLIFTHVGLSVQLLWVPVFLILLILLATGFSVLFSAANLFFRDVKYLVEVILTFAIFFTPVFYESNNFGPWEKIILLNPVAPLLEGLNSVVVLHTAPQWNWILYSGTFSIILFVFSFWFFKKLQPTFAEVI